MPKVRLPKDVSDEVDEDPTGNKALWDRGLLNGASQKVPLYQTFFLFFLYAVAVAAAATQLQSVCCEHRRCIPTVCFLM